MMYGSELEDPILLMHIFLFAPFFGFQFNFDPLTILVVLFDKGLALHVHSKCEPGRRTHTQPMVAIVVCAMHYGSYSGMYKALW